MLTQFFTIGLLMLFSAMLPGPDFAMVTKNTLLHSRRAGLFTSLGVGCAILIHITYCILGLAIIISQSIMLFTIVKYIGAMYLLYLGINTLIAKQPDRIPSGTSNPHQPILLDSAAFRQGLLCNLLNPKATLFFLALFTVVIKPGTPMLWEFVYAIEMFIIITGWFCLLTLLLSHPRVITSLNKVEGTISKMLGLFLIAFGIALVFVKK